MTLKDFEKQKGCLNCTNIDCSIPYSEKIGFDSNGLPEGNKCFGWKNEEYETGIKRVLKND